MAEGERSGVLRDVIAVAGTLLGGVFGAVAMAYGGWTAAEAARDVAMIEERTAVMNAFGSALSSRDPIIRATALRALYGAHRKAALDYAWGILCFHTGDKGVFRPYVDREVLFATRVVMLEEKLLIMTMSGQIVDLGKVAAADLPVPELRTIPEGFEVEGLMAQCSKRGFGTFGSSWFTPNFNEPELAQQGE